MINFTSEWVEGGDSNFDDRFMRITLCGYRGEPENRGKDRALNIYLDRYDARDLAAKIAELEARNFKRATERRERFEAEVLENLHSED